MGGGPAARVGVIALVGLGHLSAHERAAVAGVFLVTVAGFGGIVTLSIFFRLMWMRGDDSRGRRVVDLVLCVPIIVPGGRGVRPPQVERDRTRLRRTTQD